MSVSVSGYNDFYEQFMFSASTSVPLDIVLERTGVDLKGRYPSSGEATVSYSGEYSMTFRNLGCSRTGSASLSGSWSGTINYHLVGTYDSVEKTVSIGIIKEFSDTPSVDYCSGAMGDPVHLLFGLTGTGALGTIGGAFKFGLEGGRNSYSGILEYWESSTQHTSYGVSAQLTLVSATEPPTPVETTTTTATTTAETTTTITTTSEFTTTEECLLTLTPKLPGAGGENIGKNDRTSYRLSLEWTGDIPASGLRIRYEVSELSGLNLQFMGINAEFSFNPVTIYQASVSHLLNIETDDAAEGTYNLRVVATIDDPVWEGPPCSAEALVFLTVGEDSVTRLTFPTLGRVSSIQGNVEIARGESGEKLQANAGTEVKAGDILVTGSESDTIVGIVSKNGLVQLWKDTATMFVGIESRPDSDGTEVVLTLQPRATACQGLSDSALMSCDLFYELLAESGIPEHLALEVLGTAVILSIWEGTVHFVSGDYEGELTINLILTPTAVIIPRGTEFTVEVASDGTTTVSTFQGFVEVVDLVSGDSITLGADQRLVLPAVGGLSEDEMRSLRTAFDPKSVEQWWSPSGQPPLVGTNYLLSIILPIIGISVAAGILLMRRRSKKVPR